MVKFHFNLIQIKNRKFETFFQLAVEHLSERKTSTSMVEVFETIEKKEKKVKLNYCWSV